MDMRTFTLCLPVGVSLLGGQAGDEGLGEDGAGTVCLQTLLDEQLPLVALGSFLELPAFDAGTLRHLCCWSSVGPLTSRSDLCVQSCVVL